MSPSGVVLMSAQNDDALALCAGTLKDEVLAERYCNEIFAATKDMVRSGCYGGPPSECNTYVWFGRPAWLLGRVRVAGPGVHGRGSFVGDAEHPHTQLRPSGAGADRGCA